MGRSIEFDCDLTRSRVSNKAFAREEGERDGNLSSQLAQYSIILIWESYKDIISSECPTKYVKTFHRYQRQIDTAKGRWFCEFSRLLEVSDRKSIVRPTPTLVCELPSTLSPKLHVACLFGGFVQQLQDFYR